MFMNFGDVKESADAFHDFTKALISKTIFGGSLPVLRNK